jgi:hypothetical protein
MNGSDGGILMAGMTPEQIRGALELARLQDDFQKTVRRTEAALDDIATYLKETRRKRPAPSMMVQYVGFRDSHFLALVATFELANNEQERAQHDCLHRDKNLDSCIYCKAHTAMERYTSADPVPLPDEGIESPIGTTFTRGEMEGILADHFRGEYARALYDDCTECGKESDAA